MLWKWFHILIVEPFSLSFCLYAIWEFNTFRKIIMIRRMVYTNSSTLRPERNMLLKLLSIVHSISVFYRPTKWIHRKRSEKNPSPMAILSAIFYGYASNYVLLLCSVEGIWLHSNLAYTEFFFLFVHFSTVLILRWHINLQKSKHTHTHIHFQSTRYNLADSMIVRAYQIFYYNSILFKWHEQYVSVSPFSLSLLLSDILGRTGPKF